MHINKAKLATKNHNFPQYGSAEFSRRIEEGLRRAPEERAKAVKEFWGWITGAR